MHGRIARESRGERGNGRLRVISRYVIRGQSPALSESSYPTPFLPHLPVEHMAALDVDGLQHRLRAFADARDWERFHSPKNLAMGVASEAGELVDVFQWLTDEESRHLSDENRLHATEEIADVLIYVLRLGDKLEVDFQKAILEKLELNERRYPVELAKGNAFKYNRRG